MQKQKNQKQIVYADVAIHDMPEKVSYKAKDKREIKPANKKSRLN